jgi:hypothetical protein
MAQRYGHKKECGSPILVTAVSLILVTADDFSHLKKITIFAP